MMNDLKKMDPCRVDPEKTKRNNFVVYISGAVSGTADYMDRFVAAEKHLSNMGYTVINPARINAQLPSEITYEQYMKMSLFLMDMCNVLYQLNGWENSKGANREYGYALGKDMYIVKDGDLDENDSI